MIVQAMYTLVDDDVYNFLGEEFGQHGVVANLPQKCFVIVDAEGTA